NKDGFVRKDDLPPFLAAAFDQADANGDGKLDRKEVAVLLQTLRKRFAQPAYSPAKAAEVAVERMVDSFLTRMDTNKDGKISRAELQGTPYAALFEEIDTNKDGKIDPKEFKAYLKKKTEQKEAAEKKKEADKK